MEKTSKTLGNKLKENMKNMESKAHNKDSKIKPRKKQPVIEEPIRYNNDPVTKLMGESKDIGV